MNDIKLESTENLMDWFEAEVQIDHYDPVETPPRAPYPLEDLRTEIRRRLDRY